MLCILTGLSVLTGCAPSESVMVTDTTNAFIDARATLRQAAEDGNPVTRSHAIEALTQTSGRRSGGLFIQALGDENPAVRFAAAMAVREVKYARAKPRLLKMAKDKKLEPDKRVLCAVIHALHQFGNNEYTYALGELLFDKESEVRANAAMVMGRMGEPTAIGPLKTLLSDEQDPAVKLQIRESLAMLGDTRSQHLLEAYTKGYFLDLRLAAIPALAKTTPRRAMYVLRGLLANDKSPRVRIVAAGALAGLGEIDEAGYKLSLNAAGNPRRVLKDAYGENRRIKEIEVKSLQRLAAISLGNMKRDIAVDALHPLLKSSDGGVRVAAAMGILKLLKRGDKVPQKPAPAAIKKAAKPKPELPRPKLHTAGGKD